jgi:hypothetical protein
LYLVGADGHKIYLDNNPDAQNPTYDQLISFIKEDDTNHIKYDYNKFVCADFAERLHNNAEQNGIRTAYVDIEFEDRDDGHTLNGFQTTDNGFVYIDCTGGSENVDEYEVEKYDKISYLEIGEMETSESIHGISESESWDSNGVVKSIDIYW